MLNVVMLSVVMLSVVMLTVVMLSVVMLSVVMLNVVAPSIQPTRMKYLESLTMAILIIVVQKLMTYHGAMPLSITTFGIMALSIMALSIMAIEGYIECRK